MIRQHDGGADLLEVREAAAIEPMDPVVRDGEMPIRLTQGREKTLLKRR
jgi:hypothetical protein